MNTEILHIYTDGSCKGNPGRGGWAFYIPSTEYNESGVSDHTTNNIMELKAIIKALEYRNKNVLIKTDSKYVQLGITKWILNWKKNGWKTCKNEPVKNQNLWLQLDNLMNDTVQFEWVKGHASDMNNNIVDRIANNY